MTKEKILICTQETYKRQLMDRMGIEPYYDENEEEANNIYLQYYWLPETIVDKILRNGGARYFVSNSIYVELLECEFDDEFGGILAKFLIDDHSHWLGQQLDHTDEGNIFKIGPDCWELFDGKMAPTAPKPISQELFDKAIHLAADELNISIL
jgi:hypothetical protein